VDVPEPTRDREAADDCESEVRDAARAFRSAHHVRDCVTCQELRSVLSPDPPEGRWWIPVAENFDASCAVQSEIERNEQRMHYRPMKPWHCEG
jgi:hypothetical protein